MDMLMVTTGEDTLARREANQDSQGASRFSKGSGHKDLLGFAQYIP